MKIKYAKFFNSIKVGSRETMTVKDTDVGVEAELIEKQLIKITHPDGVVYTSLYNCQWFTVKEPKEDKKTKKLDKELKEVLIEDNTVKGASVSSIKRGRKKKAKADRLPTDDLS